ncbi:hypothetical protein MTO96_032791 [Rhipicephalus appendiculatus]
MTSTSTEDEVSSLFELVRRINVSSRLRFNWINPRGSDFAKGAINSQVSSTTRNFDDYGVADAAEFLGRPRLHSQHIRRVARMCRERAARGYKADRNNRQGQASEARGAPPRPSHEWSSATDRWSCSRLTCERATVTRTSSYTPIGRELQEAIPRNRFLVDVQLRTNNIERYNDAVIRSTIRRNHVLVNEAVRFIKGSMEKGDALAFETLQNCASLHSSLRVSLSTSDDTDVNHYIDEARKRLSLNYFVLTKVVKANIVCHPHRKERTRFDKLSKAMQAHICSFLSLTDVVEC